MAVDRVERRMAAILAADVVGYSRLIGADEERTLANLRAYREIIDGLVAHYAGRIFGSAGDSVIAEFASPVEAVRCATEIQLEIGKRNADVPEAGRMRFRVGINFGDIVVDGSNLMGDGVNIAARLEALSSPGGICISEAVHAQVRDRLSLEFLDLGEHRVKNIARAIRAYRVPLASEEQVGSPFRGLDAFDFDHAGLFFGRARAIATCTERLEQLAAGGKAFLLIYGMSGSGKSSLLRAGVLPALTKPEAVAGIALWRRCLIRPSEASNPVASLVAGLLREDALPEMGQKKSPAELMDLFLTTPDRAPAQIRQALGKAATAAGVAQSRARLVLAVDQLEELFTTVTEPTAREDLVRLLTILAGSGFVWVIGTIRGDFFHRCSEVPGFSLLKDGLSSYELLPPTGAEIAQIIREPARAAGQQFEEDPDQGRLDDVLQAAAMADPGSLPLLEFTLDALYEAGHQRRLLTFAAYRALGGLEGAIARRADEVVDALPNDIQDALPGVLRALTTVRLGDEAIAASPALLADVADTPAKSALVDALISARLFVSDESAEGHAIVRVAHEALLTRWPRARDIVNANRSFFETRARLQTDARRWQSDSWNPELLLPPGKRLAEGEELLLSHRKELGDQIASYIGASYSAQNERVEKERQAERRLIEAAQATKRERLEREAERLAGEAERRDLAAAAATRLARRTRYAALVALVLAVLAGIGAFVGFKGQGEARRQAELAGLSATQAKEAEKLAIAAGETAVAARDQALRNQSLSLAFLSQQIAAAGDTEAATLLALEALPKNMDAPDRPYLVEAEGALYNALLVHRQTAIFRHDGRITDAKFDAAGERIVTSSDDKTARIWNAKDGSEIAILKGHQDVVERAIFSPDGDRVMTAARDGTARIWAAGSGEQILVLRQSGEVHTAQFSPNGNRVLTASTSSETTIWDAQTGAKIVAVPDFGSISATFSPDGRSFAVGENSNRVQFWSADDGKQIANVFANIWPASLAFSPDGGRILIDGWYSSSKDNESRLWDASNGKEIAILGGFKSDTHCGSFSPDGKLIGIASIDGAARLWDGITVKLRLVLGAESGGLGLSDAGVGERDRAVVNCAFSPDSQLFAVGSTEGLVRIWDVKSGSQFAIFRGHSGLVTHVAFSPAGSLLLTAAQDRTARLWDIDGVLTGTLRHKRPPTFAVFSPDNKRIVTGGGDRFAHVWDVASGSEIASFESQDGPVQDATFSPDKHHIAIASRSGRILIWDVQSQRRIVQLEGHDAAVVGVQFNPKGNLLLSVEVDGTERLWDTSTGAQIAVLKGNEYFRKPLFSPDGQLVLTALNDNTARIWKTDGSELRVLAGHDNQVVAAAFSSDGRLVVTGSLDGTAKIWAVEDGRAVATLRGHGGPLVDVAFSQDSQSIVTASRDGTARIWRVKDGAGQAILRGDGARVSSAAFSPNTSYVVTASSQNRTVRLWDTRSGQQIAVLADQPGKAGVKAGLTRAAFSSDGTRIAVLSGEENVRVIRAFPTLQSLIDYAHNIVPRELTPCERKRYFLRVVGEVGDCSG
ncbi:adenylate/guanylate cyclase domain-containing protein [soil metagenome]